MAKAAAAHGGHGAHDEHAHPTGWRRFVYSTNHKDIGTMYMIFAIVAGIIGALSDRSPSALELQNPGLQIFPTPARLQRGRHRPRPDHDLLHGDAGDDRRLRQLVRADHDRRAGHGVPAHEQHLVLAAGRLVRAAAHLDVRRRRPGALRRRHRLDDLRAALDHRPHRPGDGLRHPVDPPGRRLLDPRRDQLHHHHLQHARAGHDAAPDAAVRVVDPGHRVPAAAVAAGAGRRDHHAAHRPQFRHPLLRSAGRRRPADVPAPVLVLRPPGGLHPDPAGLRHDQPDRLDLLEEAGVRLSGHGLRDGGDRLHRLHRLGAPHVHGRHVDRRCRPISSPPPWSSRCRPA